MTDNTPSDAAKAPTSNTAALVEAMARAARPALWGANGSCEDVGPQVLKARQQHLEEWARAYNRLRDTLVPVLWLYERPGFRAISEDRYPPGVMANAVSTATEEPLFTLPELKP